MAFRLGCESRSELVVLSVATHPTQDLQPTVAAVFPYPARLGVRKRCLDRTPRRLGATAYRFVTSKPIGSHAVDNRGPCAILSEHSVDHLNTNDNDNVVGEANRLHVCV